jgi:cytochrome d ubiquinol oxidase subunit I
MQTPQGHEIIDGEFHAVSWLDVIFNPSFPYRLTHMIIGSLLTSAFLIAGTSASRMIRKVDGPATRLVLKTGVAMAAVLAPLQVFVGDLHGLNTLEHQPAKVAAIEGIWETESGAPFTVFGFPDEDQRRTRFAIEIPKAASLILTHDPNGEVRGLEEFEGEHPPVAIVFWAFRVMLGVGGLMIVVSWWTAWGLRRGGRPSAGALRALSLMTFAGWVATLAGWYVTEVGRQPWIVYGALAVADVVAPHGVGVMRGTLTGYALLYAFLLAAYIGTLRHLGTKPAASLKLVGTGPVPDAAAAGRAFTGASGLPRPAKPAGQEP